jgi:biotin-dependent carboxylase-like uncharacterized protein
MPSGEQGGAVSRALTVVAPGPLTTVQDRGRPGLGGVGVGRSGSADRGAAALANRLVGNDPDAAVLEVTLGGLVVRAEADLVVVTTGARCPGSPVHAAPGLLRAGSTLALGAPPSGLRTYLAVRGGVAVDPVLGSRSTDVLSGLGPPRLQAGDELPVGSPRHPLPGVDLAPVADPPAGEVTVRLLPGPRADWLTAEALAALTAAPWEVTAESNRVGLRLAGPRLERPVREELPSEGLVRGALQVPPSGAPVLFLADAPVTGGYPVAGYVADDDVDRCAQLRPGQPLRLRG